MRYSLTCSCGEEVSVEALDDNDAFQKLVEVHRSHMLEKEHPNSGDFNEEEMQIMIRKNMKKNTE